MLKSLRWLNPYIWRYRWLMLAGLACAVVSAGFSLVVPVVVRQAIDAVPRMVALYQLYAGTPAEATLVRSFSYSLALGAVAIVLLSVVSGVFSFLMRRTVVVASRHIEFDLRNELYDRLQRLPQRFYRTFATGDVITRATSDIERVRRYVGPAVMYAVRAVTIVATALVVMLIISPTLTLWALLPMPFLAVAVFFVSRLIHVRTDRQQRQYSKLTSRVQEALAGIRVVKAYAREDATATRFDTEAHGYRDRTMDLVRVDAAFRPVLKMLIGVSTLLVVYVGGLLAIQGQITIGNIAEYIIYVAIMTWPVASFGYVISMIQQAGASAERIRQILEAPLEVSDTEEHTDRALSRVSGRLTFEHVSFRYTPEGPLVLEDVSFDLPAGQTLGIVGRTGSGKSTLVQMIPRLIDPTTGTIKIDGRDARELPLALLRSNIGYVPQEVFLFSDTIGHNIAFGVEDAADSAVRRAAQEADLLTNVEDFPEGFHTVLGERGITLSGGQKQRAAIARAMIREPAILALDDALSAVDTNTEATILRHLRQHYGKRTVVVVSHRISAVQAADLILVMEDGRIAERGTHDSLVRDGGVYASLYRQQLLEEELVLTD
ncbi:ABC transporter ATP-binding protein [soil metagenome]